MTGTAIALLWDRRDSIDLASHGDAMNCPRCECHIADGFYCVQCGYVPTAIDLIANGADPDLDRSVPQASRRGIVKPTLRHDFDQQAA